MLLANSWLFTHLADTDQHDHPIQYLYCHMHNNYRKQSLAMKFFNLRLPLTVLKKKCTGKSHK